MLIRLRLQLGLIARYGIDYPDVPYLVKLNSKTNLLETSQRDPSSSQWMDIDQIENFRKDSDLNILGVGYTVYLGSAYESQMLREAAQLVYNAHRLGYVTVLWMYPRGKAVKDERDPNLIAGAAGVAAALGSDFAKVNYPEKPGFESPILLKEAVQAAGRTKVVCAGGASRDAKSFLQQLYDQIHIGGASGNATGRNIHQKSLNEAVSFCNAIFAITVDEAAFLLDFGNAALSYRVYDVAKALLRFSILSPGYTCQADIKPTIDPARARAFMETYQEELPLPDPEIAALPAIIRGVYLLGLNHCLSDYPAHHTFMRLC